MQTSFARGQGCAPTPQSQSLKRCACSLRKHLRFRRVRYGFVKCGVREWLPAGVALQPHNLDTEEVAAPIRERFILSAHGALAWSQLREFPP